MTVFIHYASERLNHILHRIDKDKLDQNFNFVNDDKDKKMSVTKGPCTRSTKFSNALFSGFFYSSSFPIKILATDAKTQKIEPDAIVL